MKKMNACVALILAVALFACGVSLAAAADWPPKKLTLVWHSKAGSSGDLFMRSLAKFLETRLKVTTVVENRTGASGLNAWNALAKSKPDGSVLQGVSSTFIASPLQNKMPLNYKDFDPVAMMFLDPNCIFVSAKSPYKTLDDFFNDARENPGKLSLTGGTAGNTEFVSARRLMKEAGVEVPLVPFEGGGEGVVAVIGGHVTAGVGEYGEVQASAEGGQLKILAMFDKLPGLDIPTVADSGYTTTIEKFRGIIVRKDTPQEIKDAIFAVLQEAMEDPDFKKFYTQNHLIPSFKNGEEFYKVMDRQHADLEEALKGL